MERASSPAPEPVTDCQAGFVSKIENRQPTLLRNVCVKPLPARHRAKVAKKDRCGAYAKHTERWPLVSGDGGAIPHGEDPRIVRYVEPRGYDDAAVGAVVNRKVRCRWGHAKTRRENKGVARQIFTDVEPAGAIAHARDPPCLSRNSSLVEGRKQNTRGAGRSP